MTTAPVSVFLVRLSRFRRLFAAVVLAAVLQRQASAQQPPPSVSESIVVTATAAASEEIAVGSATTVITRERIETSGFRTVAEVLRSVPGVDLVQSGSNGSITSAQLRGANSTQTLVLVDGQRLNSPYFPGYDFSGLTTQNIERIEIVRGPFSALYGSDALGGVIQIFTRPAARGLAGQVTFEGGDSGQRGGSLFASYGGDSLGAAASYRDGRVEGDRPNSDWRQRNGALRVDGRLGESLRYGVEGSIDDGEVGVAGPVGAESPHARYANRQERLALPVSFEPADQHAATVLVAEVVSKLRFDDPDSGFSSHTEARSLQARVSDTWTEGANRLSGFASWERSRVDDSSNFGVSLDGQRTTIWGAGIEDIWKLSGGFTATAGLRYDSHSQFGSAWSPRGNLSWSSADLLWKLRASAGGAFRAPTVGELYYPFSGNADLKPERSSSLEIGAERYLSGGRLEASLFWNDFRDLIVYDFSRFQNFNVGRARTRGIELAVRKEIGRSVSLDVGYTYLDAKDRDTGLPLIRRPQHRAFLSATWRALPHLSIAPRLTVVGTRADRDALTGQNVEEPAYARIDLFTRYEIGSVAPYVRVENLTGERYQEVNGYPAPRRRYALGIEARF